MKFYITFGQASPARSGWIELEAPDAITARLFCSSEYKDQHWRGCYDEDFWKQKNISIYFPAGCLGKEIVTEDRLPKKVQDQRFEEPDPSKQ